MRIGTNIGMSNSPDAATFETGPAYEYTFAMDFSKLVSGDVDLGINAYANFPKVIGSTQLDRIEHIGADALREGEGILIETKTGQTDPSIIGFPYLSNASGTDNLHIKSHFTSYSVDGIPDGAISLDYPYISIVMTINSVNEAGVDTDHYNEIGFLRVYRDGSTTPYGHTSFHGTDKGGDGNDYPRFINGVNLVEEGVTGRDVSSGFLTSGTSEFDKVMTLTWDMRDSVSPSLVLDGPIDVEEVMYQLTGAGGEVSVMFHGIIFSKDVPGEVALPIHTSRPIAAFA